MVAFEAMHMQMHQHEQLPVVDGDLLADHDDAAYLQMLAEAARAAAAAAAAEERRRHLRDVLLHPRCVRAVIRRRPRASRPRDRQ